MLPLALALALCGCRTDISSNGVPNLAVVSPGVYRGGQPAEAGWLYLRTIGVTNVVKLNTNEEGSDNYMRAMGASIWYRPVNVAQQIGLESIPKNCFDGALSTVPRQGTFIHCEHGQDRTGLFAAMWRVRVDGWTKQKAEAEMLSLGFHKSLIGLWEFWEEWKP